MKLSDQIALLGKTLEEFGYTVEDGESIGEAAASAIRDLEISGGLLAEECKMYGAANGELKDKLDEVEAKLEEAHFQEFTQSDKDRIAQLEDELAECHVELALYRKEPVPEPQEPADELEEVEPTVELPDDATHLNCRHIKSNKHGDLCHNEEAFRAGLTQRGHPVSGPACRLWERAE